MSISWATWLIKLAPFLTRIDDIEELVATALKAEGVLAQYDAWTAAVRPLVEIFTAVTGLSHDEASAEAHVMAFGGGKLLERLKKLRETIEGSPLAKKLLEAALGQLLGGLIG